MYVIPGIICIVLSGMLLNWARARDGRPNPKLAESEFAGGIIVIAIIVTFTVGVALGIMEFTG